MKIIPFEKSFASNEKSKSWSLKNELKPSHVYKSSHKKFIFDCNICKHEFQMRLDNITNRNQWCNYCSNPSQKLCGIEECVFCFNKSFASNEKAKYWSSKNVLKPRNVFRSSNNKFIFNCYICDHEFVIQLNQITNMNSWCPKCK